MKRKARAHWEGTGKDGKGTLSTKSGVLDNTQYSFTSRFENGIGTNPEELIGAAHSGCFTMKLAFVLNAAGFTASSLDTDCIVTLGDGAVTSSHLVLSAQVDEISDDKFAECVEEAKNNCPISKLLDTEITIEYVLNED